MSGAEVDIEMRCQRGIGNILAKSGFDIMCTGASKKSWFSGKSAVLGGPRKMKIIKNGPENTFKPFEKNIFDLHIQIHKYNLLKYKKYILKYAPNTV